MREIADFVFNGRPANATITRPGLTSMEFRILAVGKFTPERDKNRHVTFVPIRPGKVVGAKR